METCRGASALIASYIASSTGDPHLTFAHGGRADFRGEHKQLFNFLSAANTSINVRFKNASINNGFQDIDGTYIT